MVMRKVRTLLLLLVVAGLCAGLAAFVGPRSVLAADVVYNRFDVDIAIQPNGDFRVTETQDITYPSGTFTRASRTIGLASVTDIKDVAVSEGGRNYTQAQSGTAASTFTLTRTNTASNKSLKIDWFYAQAAGQTRTFVISYTVVGGLRIYDSGDVLDWAALRDDLAANVTASTVTVILPQAVDDPSRIKTDSRGAAARAAVTDGRTARFTAAPVGKTTGLEVKVTFPHGLVTATAPAWQGRFDANQRQDAIGNLITVVSAAFGFLILVGGAVGLYLLWYLRGRDRYAGLVADYLRQPPSDLSPGVAGTLIDERADLQDVLATLTDLGRKGVLKIDEQQTPSPFGFGGSRDFVITRLPHEGSLTKFERTLIETLFIGGGDEVRLSQVKANMTNSLPRFGRELYDEVVERGYFDRSPEATRARYKGFGVTLIVLAFAAWIALSVLFGGIAHGVTATAIPLALIGVALIFLSRVMPAKTLKGAEESAKWNAFKRYLANLEKYDNLENAKEIFERYLPYATAFGLDRSFIQKFASVSTPAPQWYGGGGGPIIIGGPGGGYYGGPGGGYYGGGGYPGGGPGGGNNDGGGGGWQIPSLQDLSDRGGGGVQNWSDSLSDMLNSAGSAFGGGGGDGGGWSGGGGGDSGGGGGGDSGGSSFG
jgi:uncharacterized membrane protein YccF (DUF307 family)